MPLSKLVFVESNQECKSIIEK